MDHAHEDALWKEIGDAHGRCDELRAAVARLRRRDRLSFVLMFFLGIFVVQLAGFLGAVSSEVEQAASRQRLYGACWMQAKAHYP